MREQIVANLSLLVFVVGFWALFAIGIKYSNWRAGKRWHDGPSLVPVIPMLPILAILVGAAINFFASPWGLWTVIGLHVGLLMYGLFAMRPHNLREGQTKD
jgi:hypothetical protein